ncbi:MAG: hypothetical protein KKA62_04370 [Nanoarchaeota archaeon]|nr:hypothetical protein [Nanoarchaeota archaeon]MBU1643919.1 hypothetical protein [Nanoarchaeota archaeon]MBU1977155.1 hypothetical protein [Nanoarchaeota archaeon]
MKKIIFGILIVFLLILVGCSTQTSVKYQCVDGSFVDSVDLCDSKTCPETNCPELDCSSCPIKKEIQKSYQYQCFDGNFKDSISDCSEFVTNNPSVSSKCSNAEYKDVTSIELELMWKDPESILSGLWSAEDYYKWYPSLNEGKVFGVDTYIKNIGCTKIKPKYNLLLIKGNKILEEKEDAYFRGGTGLSWGTAGFGSDKKEYYPEDWSYSFESFEFMDGIKVSSSGLYVIRLIAKDELTGKTIGTAETSFNIG